MDKEINKEKIKAIDAKIAKLKAQDQRINAVASRGLKSKWTKLYAKAFYTDFIASENPCAT